MAATNVAVVVIKLFLTVTLQTSLIAGFRHCLLVGQGIGAFRLAPPMAPSGYYSNRAFLS
jgi:hypothetical protein